MTVYKRIIIIPYETSSSSARALKESLQKKLTIPVLIVSKTSKTYQPRFTDYVINWGCSTQWEFITNNVKYWYIKNAVNKLSSFMCFKKTRTPRWTNNKEEAINWNTPVVCRTILNGHSGAGIVLANTPDEIVDAPLYVEYKKKRNEYRVHVFRGEVFDITQKKRKKGAEHLDNKIRNHQNGWVYCRDDIYIPEDLKEQALLAIEELQLTFGAVDIIWNEKENKCYVLEVNTAPGLYGTTLENYTNSFLLEIQNAI